MADLIIYWRKILDTDGRNPETIGLKPIICESGDSKTGKEHLKQYFLF